MKLKKWALIAEIVGSVAVVVTLIVLIIEIRGNTEEMRAATVANVAARTQAIPMARMTNPQWADVIARLMAGDELTPSEEAQVFGYLITVLKLAEESFIAYRDGRLEEEIWQTRAALALGALDRKRDRESWEFASGSGVFVQEFVDWIDAAIVERYGKE